MSNRAKFSPKFSKDSIPVCHVLVDNIYVRFDEQLF